MTERECCVSTSDGLSFSVPGSDPTCHVCVGELVMHCTKCSYVHVHVCILVCLETANNTGAIKTRVVLDINLHRKLFSKTKAY